MEYQMLVLDLDGTLTNSKKELTEPTRKALIEIQEGSRQESGSGQRPPHQRRKTSGRQTEPGQIWRIYAFFQRCPDHTLHDRSERLQ